MERKKAMEIAALYAEAAAEIYGTDLNSILLFGSYARGDFDAESDIDLMVLLDVPKEQIPLERRKMRKTADSLDMKYDCVLSAVFQSTDVFEQFKEASGFFRNVAAEGIRIR